MKILVIHAHALHLGYLGCYGNEWVETPTLNRLAAEGIVFDQHFAAHPGVAIQLTNDIPHSLLKPHRGEEPEAFLERAAAAVAEAAPQSCLWLDWPNFNPPWQVPEEILELYFGVDIVGEDGPTPWIDPPIGPCADADEQLGRLQDSYAAAVTWFDTQLDAVLQLMADDWLVIVTAACGFALGEHGIIGPHRAWLHDELVHLPLLFRFPDNAHAGTRLCALTQPDDLLATIAELLQHAPTGAGLLPLIRSEMDELRPHACSEMKVGESVECSLRTRDWAFLLPVHAPADDSPRTPQLYVRPDDRWEVNNLYQRHLDLADGFEKILREQFVRY